MKFFKLNEEGLTHWLVIGLFFLLFAAVGYRVLKASHAAPSNPASYKVNIGRPMYQSNPNDKLTAKSVIQGQSADQLATGGILPPNNPSESLAPNPNFTGDGSCPYYIYSNTTTCSNDAVSAINSALNTLESLPALSLNMSAFENLTAPEQIFVITNVERVNRGLPPAVALTTQLNQVAQTAASASTLTDPDLSVWSLTGGTQVYSWGSNAAEGTSNALGSDYYYMYDDGYGGVNGDCTTPSSQWCWGHRDNILGTFINNSECSNNPNTYMGTGYTPGASSTFSTYTEILVGACGTAPTDVVFTWTQALQLLNGSVTTPSAPQQVTAVTSAKKGINLAWQAPSNSGGASVTSYDVYRSTKPSKEKLIKNIKCTASSCSYFNTSAQKAIKYYYIIAAVNSAGKGQLSTEVSATGK